MWGFEQILVIWEVIHDKIKWPVVFRILFPSWNHLFGQYCSIKLISSILFQQFLMRLFWCNYKCKSFTFTMQICLRQCVNLKEKSLERSSSVVSLCKLPINNCFLSEISLFVYDVWFPFGLHVKVLDLNLLSGFFLCSGQCFNVFLVLVIISFMLWVVSRNEWVVCFAYGRHVIFILRIIISTWVQNSSLHFYPRFDYSIFWSYFTLPKVNRFLECSLSFDFWQKDWNLQVRLDMLRSLLLFKAVNLTSSFNSFLAFLGLLDIWWE